MTQIGTYIRYRLKALQLYYRYDVQLRNLLLQGGEQITVTAGTDLYLLTTDVEGVRIESETGLYESQSLKTNQLVYEHSGQIILSNQSIYTIQIPFLQITFKNK